MRQPRRIDPKRVLLGAGVVVTAGIAGLIVYSIVFLFGGRVSREGSVESSGGRLEVEEIPSSYRIVFRVDEFAGGDHRISTEEFYVRRPFDGHTEKKQGPPPGGVRQTGQTSIFGRVSFPAAGDVPVVLTTAPAIAVGDLRPDAVIEEGVRSGLLERREVRRIAGRRCQVYRAAGPVTAGQIVGVEEDTDELSDFCIDESGLLLEEVWLGKDRRLRVLERNRAIRRKVAIKVEEDPTLSEELFKVGEPTISMENSGGSLRALKPDSRMPGRFWVIEGEKLAGFELFGRYLVVPASMEIMGMQGTEGGRQSNRIVSVSDVYVKEGRDLFVLDRGTTQRGSSPFGKPPEDQSVDLGGELGVGHRIRDLRMNEVRTNLEDGTFIRVYGTFPTSFLVAMIKSVKPVEGSDLQFLE